MSVLIEDRRGSATVPATLIALSLAAMALHLVRPVGLVGELSYLGGYVAATALTWVGVSRWPRSRRGPWLWIAAGVSLTMAADLAYQILAWTGIEPDVSVADLFWITSYIALAIGLLRLSPTRRRRGIEVEGLIDTIVALVVAFVWVWELVLDDMVGDTTTSGFVRGVWAAYPILDATILSLVIRLLLGTARSVPLVLVAAGSVCWLVADLGYLVYDGGYATSTGLDLAWMAALLLVGAGALPSREATAPVESALAERWRMGLVLAPLVVPTGFMLWGQVTHDHPNTAVMLGSSVTLIALAWVRSHRLLRAMEAARQEVQDSEHLFRALAANASDAVFVAGPDGLLKEGQDSLARLLEVAPAELDGASAVTGKLTLDPASLERLLERTLAAPGVVFDHETQVRRQDGSVRWLQGRIVNMLDDPVVGGIVANVQDVTERKRAEEELRHLAFHDGLTGLANRDLLIDRIEQATRRAGRRGTNPAVIYLDLDGFKAANDRHGHGGGDRLLRTVAERLAYTVRSEDTVARVGGDEFVVLIEENHPEAAEAVTTAERIQQALSVPVDIGGGREVRVTASVGVAVGEVGCAADELLRNADIAMYRAKAAGKARVLLYDPSMGDEAGEALLLEGELEHALAQDQLELHYQPVVDLRSDKVVGFEALLRWRHPRLGLVAPDRFIPLAESTGLIVPIGRWVLETACATAARWQSRLAGDPPRLTMAVNLSARQLADDRVVDDVRRALAAVGLPPSSLVLEMTETALVVDPAAAADRLRSLRALGVRVAIDDFGTGYSSLAYLRQFPIDILKIDRSFVETITDPDDLPPIVRGLLDLGHTLDLEIVAEGIEREVQRDGLRLERCDLGQGFLFSRAVPEAQAETLIDAVAPEETPRAPAR
jgi:diguanylate cyclase (GGDEF)-like protein/PAS domain S-box-containing protein